ncbi:MAG: ATP-dependent DNA helicase RecG [Pseudomonadota bacterium]
MPTDPEAAIGTLKGVGPSLQETLAKLGIYRLIDLLLHLPLRYQDRSRITPVAEIRAGEEHLIQARIADVQIIFGKRRSLKVTVEDDSGRAYLRFFHFNKYQRDSLQAHGFVRAFGEFKFFGRELSAAHPEYELFAAEPAPPVANLTPIYPTTQGLGQARIRKLAQTLCELPWPTADGTPYATLQFLHQPPAGTSPDTLERAQQDVAMDELTAYYLVMKGRALQRQQQSARGLPRSKALGRELLRNLGFRLTQAQARVVGEVLTDLEQARPMLRLVQGDVGSGKTIVAAFAAIRAAEQNCQTALMAPTELLAEQHHANFSNWLSPLGLRVTLLTGQLPAKDSRERLQAVADGSADVVIGTHALFQDKVEFNKLALSIIDEQHRFGVYQRMALKDKAGQHLQPHQLVMTATPIPRTLTMALYADMDVSVIDELPKGRQPIQTHTLPENKRPQLVEAIHKVLQKGQQGYWVCTLIDESDELEATAATTLAEQLKAALPDKQVALLHGRMRSEEKLSIMHAFKNQQIDLLVATTVIEVGVDVPNATHMVIENAERLGLAQLHQLRGRVGRGQLASHCYLLHSPRVSNAGEVRIQAMCQSQDGFYLAEEDLKLRGPGDILGARQAGEQSFRIADLGLHAHLMPTVIQRGNQLLQASPGSPEAHTMLQLLTTWAPADSGHLTV